MQRFQNFPNGKLSETMGTGIVEGKQKCFIDKIKDLQRECVYNEAHVN